MSRIAFFNDTSEWYHWGCTGTSVAIKEALAARGHSVFSVPISLLYECGPLPKSMEDFDSPEFFRQFFKANMLVAAAVLHNDVVLINGEGSLHGLSRISVALLYIAYASKKFCHKNVQIINHSCYPD